MNVRLERLDLARREDFLAVLRQGSAESAPCLCTAYHGAAGDEPGAGQRCRDRLFQDGKSDGYLLYLDERPVGWCQCGPWGSFGLLAPRPHSNPGAWAITCMVLAPEARGKGLAHTLFREVLDDLRRRGVAYVVAFGHRLGPTYSSPLAELPESVCRKAGMSIERDDPECPRYGMALGSQL